MAEVTKSTNDDSGIAILAIIIFFGYFFYINYDRGEQCENLIFTKYESRKFGIIDQTTFLRQSEKKIYAKGLLIRNKNLDIQPVTYICYFNYKDDKEVLTVESYSGEKIDAFEDASFSYFNLYKKYIK